MGGLCVEVPSVVGVWCGGALGGSGLAVGELCERGVRLWGECR